MRRQFAVLVTATTSLVVLAFLVPLGFLLYTLAESRAVAVAVHEAQNVAVVVAVVPDPAQLEPVVTLTDQRSARSVTVFLPDGQVVGADIDAKTQERALDGEGRSFSVSVAGGREVFVPVETSRGRAVVRSFVPTSLLHRGVALALVALGLLGLVLVGVALLIADRLARGTVRPVIALADAARQLAEGDLAVRVVPAGPPEVRDVGRALNQLADRIDELLETEREHVADLSHRLRTPLTALRLDVEALRNKTAARRLGDDVAGVVRVVDDIIRAASRPVREGFQASCDAAHVVTQRMEFWGVLAEDQERPWDLVADPGPLPVRLLAEDLAAALDALLGNAFAHTPDGTPVRVEVAAEDGVVRISVVDEGPGLPEDALVRGRSGAGSTGLGLDIARRTAEAAGGELVLERPTEGGTRVVLLLPLR